MRQNSIACVALNTCSLAFSEAERYLPSLIDKIDILLRANGLEKTAINIRMTGCPNGCGRPYLGEIAFIGKSPGYYNLYLGAAHNGERLNKLYREMLNEEAILAELAPILARYARERAHGERFGDFVIRKEYMCRRPRTERIFMLEWNADDADFQTQIYAEKISKICV